MKVSYLFLLLIAVGSIITVYLILTKSRKITTQINMNTAREHIRLPAVAGSFYPSSVEILKTDISGYLNQANPASVGGLLKILIVPHAGISYSGPTAGW